MVEVVALQGMEHNGSRKRGQRFNVSEHQAKALERAGLVARKASATDPNKAVGAKSSASPAAQASPQTTSKKSKRGGQRKKAEVSS